MLRTPRSHNFPDLIYGTAFKYDETALLVGAALRAGFTAVDTSGNEPQYREAEVGEGIALAIKARVVERSDLHVCKPAPRSRLGQTIIYFGLTQHNADTNQILALQTRQKSITLSLRYL